MEANHKSRARRSKVWGVNQERFAEIIRTSSTIAQVSLRMQLTPHGSTYRTIYERIKMEGVDVSHIRLGKGHNRGRKFRATKQTDGLTNEEIFTKPSSWKNIILKRVLIERGLMDDRCYGTGCDLGSIWHGKPLTIQLHHRNGDRTDNRIENLILLCPNCHTQTDTFGSKNGSGPRKRCIDCGSVIGHESTRCQRCAGIEVNQRTGAAKFEVSKEELNDLIWNQKVPFVRIGRMFGVTDNAIRKRAKRLCVPIRKIKFFV